MAGLAKNGFGSVLNITVVAAVFMVTVTGASLRLYNLGGQGIGLDEMHTLLLANGRAHAFFNLKFDDGELDVQTLRGYLKERTEVQPLAVVRDVYRTESMHTPLYIVLVNLFIAVMGANEFALRLPSALCGTLTIPFLFLLGRRLWNTEAGLIGAGLFAVSPFQVFIGQEARMYSMMIFLSMLATWAIVELSMRRISRERDSWALWLTYFLAITIGFYTDPLSVLIVGIHFPFVLVSNRGDRPFLTRFLLVIGLSAIVCSAWYGISLIRGAKGRFGIGWLQGRWPILELLGTAMKGFGEFVCGEEHCANVLVWAWSILIGLGFLAIRRHSARWLLPLWVLGPPAFVIFLDIMRGTHAVSMNRYYMLAAPAIYLLMAIGIAVLRPPHLSRILAVLIVGYMAVSGYETAVGAISRRDDFKNAAYQIAQESRPEDAVVLVSAHAIKMSLILSYYLERPEKILPIRVEDFKDIDWTRYADRLGSYDRVTILTTWMPRGPATDFDPRSTSAALPFLHLMDVWSYQGVYVVQYQRQ